MAFFILPLLSTRDLDIGPKGFSPRDDISRGLMTRAIWKRPCINLFISYFAREANMLLPFTRGHITCYCPRKMLFPRRQITRHKLCFYSTCKFGVISITYVINPCIDLNGRLYLHNFIMHIVVIYIFIVHYNIVEWWVAFHFCFVFCFAFKYVWSCHNGHVLS